MFDRYYLHTLFIGLIIQLAAVFADRTGWLTASTRGILNGISLFFMVVGLFLLGRLIGKIILLQARRRS